MNRIQLEQFPLTSWPTFASLDTFMEPAWTKKQWEELNRANEFSKLYRLFGLYGGTELKGFCLFYGACFNEEAHLLKLVIAPAYRKQGLAEELMRHSFLTLGVAPGGQIYLEVAASNMEAQRLYDRLGFTSLGELKDFYGQGQNALSMQKLL